MNLRQGGPTAACSALALVVASVVGALGASAATSPPAPPDAPPGSVTTPRINDLHDGFAVGSLAPPLHRAWSRDLGATVESPLVVDGRVFVATERPDGHYGTQLWGLDAVDGSTIWGPLSVSDVNTIGGIAADGAYVYVADVHGRLSAFDQATGHEVWSVQLPGKWNWAAPPTVRHGTVYVAGSGLFPLDEPYGSPGALDAVSASDGGVLWTAPLPGTEDFVGWPTATDDGVYISSGCDTTYRFDPSTGRQVWAQTTRCLPRSLTTVVHDGRVWAWDSSTYVSLDAATGAVDGTLTAARTTPAFAGAIAYDLQAGTLRAIDTTTNQILWTQAGDGGLTNAPTVIGSEVAASSSTGRVYLLNAQTGAVDWSGDAGSPIVGSDLQNVGLDTSLTASEGRLLVPASDTLVAYEHLSATQAFVMALYQDFLGREVDRAGLAHWVAALDDGKSQASVATSIAFSIEATDTFISGAYASILGRPADGAGLAYWSSLPGGTLHANRIADALYASTEYYGNAGGTDAGWAQAIFRSILGRPAQAGEASYWATQTQRLGRKRVAASIYASQEAADLRIKALYNTLLGRPADGQGLAYFRTFVEQLGTPIAAVIIAGTSEYATHALARMK